MENSLSDAELRGHLNSIAHDTFFRTSRLITERCIFERDSVAYARVKNSFQYSPAGFASDIATHLRHIPVNPNNSSVSDLLRLAYVYTGETDSDNTYIINKSHNSLSKFIEELIESAKAQRKIAELDTPTLESISTNCTHIIHGDRGVGKTFFLNYALTLCNSQLDRHKCVWVRLNFVYTSDFEDDLEHWMHAQAAKIIFRYYDKRSRHSGKNLVSAIEHLINWVKTTDDIDDQDRREFRMDLLSMEQVFTRPLVDENIRKSLCNRIICRELYRYMREMGWSFIFVLDGFDQLDINPEQVERYDRIRNLVERFISFRAAFGAALVIVTRSNTFDDLLSYDPFKTIAVTSRYQIGRVDFEKVVSQRFDAIKAIVIPRIPEHRRDDAKAILLTINEFIATIDDDAFYQECLKFDESNIRAKLQTLYLKFLNFIDRSTGKGYLIIEHMMLNGMRYPALAYSYYRRAEGHLGARSHELTHEARFLPIITRFPMADGALNGSPGQCPFDHLLLGVRVLQFCIAARKIIDKQDLLTAGELLTILTRCFGYSEDVSLAMIGELSAYDLLRVVRSDGLPAVSRNNRIKALPKAHYLLSNCIHDVAYLNMCAMRTAFPDIFYKERFIRRANLGTDHHNAHSWVETKIINGLSLFSTMLIKNRIEKSSISNSSIEALSARERAVWDGASSQLWAAIPEARLTLVGEIMKIILSSPQGWLTNEDKEEIAERVRSLFTFFRRESRPQTAT